MMFRLRLMILISLGLIATACSAPIPDEPAPDVLTQIAQLTPTKPPATATAIPPTATALPPTATFTVEPTTTATVTPEPTATATATLTRTPVPTLVPTKPAATKALVTATVPPTKAPAAAPVPVSAIPANAPLNVAVQRTMDNLLELNKGINGAMVGAEYTCEQFLWRYNAITQAPTYDVHNQTQEIQTAYGHYRNAIDTLKTKMFEFWRTCDRGGGVIDKLVWGEALRGLSEAIGILDRAVKLLPTAAAGPEPTVTPTPAELVNMALSDLLLQTMERMHTAGGHLDGAQTELKGGFCDQFKPLYQTITTVVGLSEAGRDPLWIDSYGAYKVAIGYFQNKLYRAVEICTAGGGTIGKSEFGEMRRAVDAAAIAVARAYDRLRIANLLGQ